MAKAMRDKFIAIISLVALRGQIMTVKAHPGLCMKYSRWVICMYKNTNFFTPISHNVQCHVCVIKVHNKCLGGRKKIYVLLMCNHFCINHAPITPHMQQ